jgi:hypothetical protein
MLPSRIGAATMGLHIGYGNDKIDSTVGIFDLPAISTCPGAKACINYCYAIKTEWMGEGYPTARNRFENWAETYKPTFVRDMVRRIKKSKFKVFRAHDSGDFDRNDYIEMFAEIARRCPKTMFYAYTKSLNRHIDLTPLTTLPTHNFTIIYSEGGKYDSKINKSTDNYATIVPISQLGNKKIIRKGEYLCPELRASGKKTEKYCAYNCNYCLSSRDTSLTKRHQIRVIFPLRKGGWSGNRLYPRPPSYMIRPLPPLAQGKKPAMSTRAGAALPQRGKGETKPAYNEEAAKAVEAEFAYRHLLLAGYTTENILQLVGISDLSQLRREHVQKLMQMKMTVEETAKRKIPFKGPLGGKPKRQTKRARNTKSG